MKKTDKFRELSERKKVCVTQYKTGNRLKSHRRPPTLVTVALIEKDDFWVWEI